MVPLEFRGDFFKDLTVTAGWDRDQDDWNIPKCSDQVSRGLEGNGEFLIGKIVLIGVVLVDFPRLLFISDPYFYRRWFLAKTVPMAEPKLPPPRIRTSVSEEDSVVLLFLFCKADRFILFPPQREVGFDNKKLNFDDDGIICPLFAPGLGEHDSFEEDNRPFFCKDL